MKEEYLIQACTGKRVDVFKGQTITVIDVSGGQVADVYKRQVLVSALCFFASAVMECFLRIPPVSYTHLPLW